MEKNRRVEREASPGNTALLATRSAQTRTPDTPRPVDTAAIIDGWSCDDHTCSCDWAIALAQPVIADAIRTLGFRLGDGDLQVLVSNSRAKVPT